MFLGRNNHALSLQQKKLNFKYRFSHRSCQNYNSSMPHDVSQNFYSIEISNFRSLILLFRFEIVHLP